jgi:hypothetical protein
MAMNPKIRFDEAKTVSINPVDRCRHSEMLSGARDLVRETELRSEQKHIAAR